MRGIGRETASECRSLQTALGERLGVGQVCDCPRHNPEATGYDACICPERGIEPKCVHVRRWGSAVEPDPSSPGRYLLVIGAGLIPQLRALAADVVDIDAEIRRVGDVSIDEPREA